MTRTTIALALTLALLLAAPSAAQNGLLLRAGFDSDLTATAPAGDVPPARVEGGPAQFADGRIGQALLSGPTGAFAHYPVAGSLIPGIGTLSLWVKPLNWEPGDEAFHSFVESGGEDGDRNWFIFYKYYQRSALLLRLSDADGNVGVARVDDLAWQPGEWHHLAATWSPLALRIYVDGELAAEETGRVVVPDRVGETFRVGDNGWHMPHAGAQTLIDELRIYSRPLNADEIRHLAGRLSLTVRRLSMQARWQCDVRLPDGVEEGTVTIEVTPSDGEQAALVMTAEAADGVATASLDVAELPAGRYTVTATMPGASALPGSVEVFQPEQATYVLANERVRVVFDGATGGILAISDPASGVTMREPAAPAPILTAEAVGFEDHPWFYAPGDVTEVPCDDAHLTAIDLARGEDGSRLTMRYALPGDARVTITADLPDDSASVALQAVVENARPLWASDAIRIPRVTFPAIDGLRVGEAAADDLLATGRVHGMVFTNPAATLTSPVALDYPGVPCVPWLDLFDETGGGVHLTPLEDGTHGLQVLYGAGTGDTLSLGNAWWPLLEPGETWTSPVVELGVHAGRWHPVAERFRRWALANTPPREQPEWLDECDGWFGMGWEQYRWSDLPDILADAKQLGLFYMQMWSEMILGENYYCYFYPNPDMGTPEELRAAVDQVHAEGGRIGFYSNVITFDAGIDRNPGLLAEIAKFGLEDEIDLPRFYEEVAPQTFIGPDGSCHRTALSQAATGYVDGYWPMDPASPWWREYLASWIMRWQDEWGVDTWYLDSFPVRGYGLGGASFALHLDHPVSVSEGQIGLLQHIRERGFRGGLLYEGCASAALIPTCNWALGTEYSFGSNEFSRPEIFCYSFSDVHPVFSGTANTWKGIGNIWPDLVEPTQEDAMNLVFLNGERFDILARWPLEPEDPFIQHMQGLLGMRRKLRDVVYTGRMMDELGLSGMPERVEARLFVLGEPPVAAITVVDRREERAPWTLTIDPTAVEAAAGESGVRWPDGLSSARMLLHDGSERALEITRDGDSLRIEMRDTGEVCAIRFGP